MFLFTLLLNFFTIYLPLLLIGLFIPSYTKKSLFFGIAVPEDFAESDQFKKLKREYLRNHSISLTVAMGIIIAIGFNYQSIRVINAGIFILMTVFTANYLYTHLKIKKLKEAEGWLVRKKQVVMVSTNSGSSKRKIAMKYHCISAVIVIFTWILTATIYRSLPDRIPMRFDFQGEVVGYGHKSFLTVFGIPLTQLGMFTLFFYLTIVIGKSKLMINPAKPKTSEKQNIIANRRWGIFMVFTSILLNGYFLYLQLTILQVLNLTATTHIAVNILSIALPIMAVIVVALKTGQSGSRITIDSDEEENKKLIYRDEDKYWKWGMFYYNKQDPSLWIEKRFGIGWTINMGHPVGMAIGFITLVVLLYSIIITIYR
ncbi:putative membrane protein [Clostridium aceticum]|uniref:Putative membrane protein n=1 Tax=Clostridium aceticum TaxID=84022 RepID=A0A0D8IA52_9CLOT|nr:DUF5808 domain-containing protein [Clostridium aceticum]AKL96298.1 putative membrane protein [Clostridium aceticum]KJF26897.1 hypothetical protein TZ02_10165 [Clostridium aceticum]